MKMIYTEEYYLRSTDFDMYAHILPRGVMDMFQDAAGRHNYSMGIGFTAMKARGLAWIVARTRYELVQEPLRQTTVKVVTWPRENKGKILRREFLVYNQAGELLIKGAAVWMLVSFTTHKTAEIKDVYPKDMEFSDEFALTYELKKVKSIQGDKSLYAIHPNFVDVDVNGHVNNTRYGDFIMNALEPQDRMIKSFQIDYNRELFRGDKLTLETISDGARAVSHCVDANGTKHFSCETIFE